VIRREGYRQVSESNLSFSERSHKIRRGKRKLKRQEVGQAL